MMMRILATVVLITAALVGLPAHAQKTCIQTYLASSGNVALGFEPSDVEKLVSQIAGTIALSAKGIKIIPCSGTVKVQYQYFSEAGLPVGDYILYDPVWVREVIGPDISGSRKAKASDEAVFLFGHELGHILGRHFTANAGMERFEKEKEADSFAGCAAGALAADWNNISGFIERIRGEQDTTYPSRKTSLQVAKESFDKCRKGVQSDNFVIAGAGPDFDPPKMNGRTLDGCMIDEKHPAGNNCTVQASQTIAAQFCMQAGFLTSATFTTEFTPEFKSSYKLIKRVDSDGRWTFAWNKDDTGGFIIRHVSCRASEQGKS